ncbi:hypothetical protein M569_14121, partial [Genlisea aurea]
MASAQVLKKQKNLEAGKKKLEEFRQKKAAEKARKNVSTNNPSQSSDDIQNGKQTLESDNVRLRDFDGAGTSDVQQSEIPLERLSIAKESNISLSSLDVAGGYQPSVTGNSIGSSALETFSLNGEDYNDGAPSAGFDGLKSAKNEPVDKYADNGPSNQVASSFDHNNVFLPHRNQENHASSLPRYPSPDINLHVSKKTEDIPSDVSSLSSESISDNWSRNSFRTQLNDSGKRLGDSNLISSAYA